MATLTLARTFQDYTASVLRQIEPFEKDGKELRQVSNLIKIKDISGFVQLGCLVRSAPDRVTVAFYLLMNERQIDRFRTIYPEFDKVYDKESGNSVVIIDWVQYAHLRWGDRG